MSSQVLLQAAGSSPSSINSAGTEDLISLFVERRLVNDLAPVDLKAQYVARGTLKVLSVGVAAAGKYPFVALSMKAAGSNKVYGGFLAYGNMASFAALVTAFASSRVKMPSMPST